MMWKAQNLHNHYLRRVKKYPGCFEDILGISGNLTQDQYEKYSFKVVSNAWAKYECEARDQLHSGYHPQRVYFVNGVLCVSVTENNRTDMVTCYHEHFNMQHKTMRAKFTTEGERKLKYKEHLEYDMRGGAVRNLRWIEDV